MKPAIFFITGTSGAGKTTLVNFIKKELSNTEVHDFDEGGVPDGADEGWRRGRTNEWLEKARGYLAEGKSTVICGVCVPGEVRACSAYDDSLDVHYGMIHIEEAEIRKRLGDRGWKGAKVDDNVIWAQHLERFVKAEDGHCIVSGSYNGPEEVGKKFAAWIKRETKF